MLLYSDDTICLILYLYLLVLAILAIFTCILNNLLDKIVDKAATNYILLLYNNNVIFVWYLFFYYYKLPNKKWRKFMINNLSANINQNLNIKVNSN